MTGIELYKSALLLLGEEYESGGSVPDGVLGAINKIGYDLCKMSPISAITDTLPLNGMAQIAAIYGTAMLFCIERQNADGYNAFSEIYENRRKSVKSSVSAVVDRLPKAVH